MSGDQTQARANRSRLGVIAGSVLLMSAALAAGCQPKGPVRAALREDLPTLRAEILSAEAAGKLDRDGVIALAEAVARREIASAHGETGVRHVHALRACTGPVIGDLRRLSERHDSVGAEAWLARIQRGDFERSEALAYVKDSEPAFRAVAARVLVQREDGASRRQLFVDPDQRVRRAALEAASIAKDAADLEPLLEAFRLDPDPLARSWAARAVGAIGGERAVLGLKDRYERAEDADRLTILEAWSAPASLQSGGERELSRVASEEQGLPALTATRALMQAGANDGALQTRLRLAIERGTSDEKRLAIAYADLAQPAQLSAVEAASKDLDGGVQLAALRRLIELPAQPASSGQKRALAVAKLRALANDTSSDALDARLTLASSGELASPRDRVLFESLEHELEKGPSSSRSRVALALFGLGREARAARALADVDPSVRIAVSCGILATNTQAAAQAAATRRSRTPAVRKSR